MYGTNAHFAATVAFDLVPMRVAPPAFFALLAYWAIGLHAGCGSCVLAFLGGTPTWDTKLPSSLGGDQYPLVPAVETSEPSLELQRQLAALQPCWKLHCRQLQGCSACHVASLSGTLCKATRQWSVSRSAGRSLAAAQR